MKVAIVKYNAGNTASVENALYRLGVTPVITDDADLLSNADKVIFPGVGEASSAMSHLRKNCLDKLIIDLKQPVLGICLGMQLMCKSSEENDTNCLGIFESKVNRFNSSTQKVPHVGWNTVSQLKSGLFRGINSEDYFYFVHSYYVETNLHSIAETVYGLSFAAAIQKDNFYGVQFHPERSGETGAKLLQNFLEL